MAAGVGGQPLPEQKQAPPIASPGRSAAWNGPPGAAASRHCGLAACGTSATSINCPSDPSIRRFSVSLTSGFSLASALWMSRLAGRLTLNSSWAT